MLYPSFFTFFVAYHFTVLRMKTHFHRLKQPFQRIVPNCFYSTTYIYFIIAFKNTQKRNRLIYTVLKVKIYIHTL